MPIIDDLRAYLANLTAKDVDALHRNADTDVSRRALHHTLGPRGGQAAAGNHTHDGNDSPKIPLSNIVGFEDTGWVDLTLYALTGGSLAGHRVGRTVELRGGGFGSIAPIPPGGSPTELWTALPIEWRPSAGNRWGTGYSAGYQLPVVARPAGTGACGNQNTGFSATSLQFSIVYTLG